MTHEPSSRAALYTSYLTEVDRLLRLTPSYPDLLNRRGTLLYLTGDCEGAERDFSAAVLRNSGYEEARVNLAFAISAADFGRAHQMLAGLAKQSRTPCTRFVDLACLCFAHGRGEWKESIDHAIRLEPLSALPHHWNAYFRARCDEPVEAESEIRQVCRLSGGGVESYESLGIAGPRGIDLEKFVFLVESSPGSPRFSTFHADLCRWLAESSDHDTARRQALSMLLGDPSFAPYAALRGQLEFLWGHHRPAESWLRRALEAEGRYARAHELLAQLYLALDDDLRAERHLDAAVELSPNYPDLRYDLGILLTRTGRFHEAIDMLRSCLAIHPSFFMARFRLGECYLRLGNDCAAREHFAALPEEIRTRPEVRAVITRYVPAAEPAH